MKKPSQTNVCNLKSNSYINDVKNTAALKKKSFRTVPSILWHILAAFFPKCPMCWAVYMSMLGSFGLAKAPYMGWLLPIFLAFMGVHLCMLLRRVPEKGYGPFLSSLIGFSILLLGKITLHDLEWIVMTGMTFIVIGSFWNSFSPDHFQSV
jgi:hypothetical protein